MLSTHQFNLLTIVFFMKSLIKSQQCFVSFSNVFPCLSVICVASELFIIIIFVCQNVLTSWPYLLWWRWILWTVTSSSRKTSTTADLWKCLISKWLRLSYFFERYFIRTEIWSETQNSSNLVVNRTICILYISLFFSEEPNVKWLNYVFFHV